MKAQRLTFTLALPVVVAGVVFSAPFFGGSTINLPNTFTAGTPARAAEVNENFAAIVSGVDSLANDVDNQFATVAVDIDVLSNRTTALEDAVSQLESPQNLVVVATDGGDFTSVADALASISDASETNPYMVYVAPGVYEESDVSTVPSFVTLRGASAASTIVRSSRSGSVPNNTAATVFLEDDSSIQDITVENDGTGAISIAIVGFNLSSSVRAVNVTARADGNGGTGHLAMHVGDSNLNLVDSVLFASGASTVNSAFSSVDSGGPFAQPILQGCILEGDGFNSGFGMQISRTAAHVDDCRIVGDNTAISASIAGISTVRNSRIQTLGLNPVYETNGSATMLSGNVFFVGGNPTGLSTSFKYVWCIKANFDPVVNGSGSTVQ